MLREPVAQPGKMLYTRAPVGALLPVCLGPSLEPKEDLALAFADKPLRCRDCGIDFFFTAGEQEFYATKGLLNDPQRCPACRANRRRERNGEQPREMHRVTCAECQAETTVPFLPRLGRPVYCSICFERIRQATPI